MVESLRVLGETATQELQQAPRKRQHGTDTPGSSVTTGDPPEPTSGLSSTQFSRVQMHENFAPVTDTNWDTSSMMFGYTADNDISAYAIDYPNSIPLLQSTGTVPGNIDFAALFGFGDSSSEGLRPWSPSPFDSASSSMPSFPGSEQGTGTTTEGVLDATLDYG